MKIETSITLGQIPVKERVKIQTTHGVTSGPPPYQFGNQVSSYPENTNTFPNPPTSPANMHFTIPRTDQPYPPNYGAPYPLNPGAPYPPSARAPFASSAVALYPPSTGTPYPHQFGANAPYGAGSVAPHRTANVDQANEDDFVILDRKSFLIIIS